uniref:Hyaluronidase n=1 Tax=Lepisosteus oculatus TaxID=7918 RepID=W5NFW3_LEPOC
PLRLFFGTAAWTLTLCFALITQVNRCKTLFQTAPPLDLKSPFVFAWNAPTELCESWFNISFDLKYFRYVSSTLKSSTNQSIAIFYIDRFGIFPYVDEDTGMIYNGGLPQLINFKEHYKEAKEDIMFYIPSEQPGLAVLDFEEWRPQWIRNWGSKDIYRNLSLYLVMQQDLTLTFAESEDAAREEFEKAAIRYFKDSLRLGKASKPNRLWGYYLYPDCYNYEYTDDLTDYSGNCPDIEIARNNDLMWLWEESTALYPSIYLEIILKNTFKAALYVRHRIQESMRVSMLPKKNYSIPIYAYIRLVFKNSDQDYLSEFDLVNTIGEAAALGSAGVIAWGDMNVTEIKNSCLMLKHYLEKNLNPYIVNVSTAAKFCSTVLCNDNGRCVRKKWNTSDYLHLDPRRFIIKKSVTGALSVEGKLSQEDINFFEAKFTCLCYTGKSCRSKWMWKGIPETLYNQSP